MSALAKTRCFAALLEQNSVFLAEYVREKSGLRILGEWKEAGPNASIDDALSRLASQIASKQARHATLAVTFQNFGAVFQILGLPDADDEILRPVIRRELARAIGSTDSVFGFTRGPVVERRDGARANERTAPRQVFVGGASPATIDGLARRLRMPGVHVQGATVVPEAVRRAFSAANHGDDPTAAVVCLPSGPHVCFFIGGTLELAIEPPIGVDSSAALDPAAVVDQIDRGAVFLRQQFRGAAVTEVLLSAPREVYDAISSAINSRMPVRVRPLAPELSSPESVIAIGGVLSAISDEPLDLLPYVPTFSDKIRSSIQGPPAFATTAAAAAAIAVLWAGLQVAGLHRSTAQAADLRAKISQAVPLIAPIRTVALQRAGYGQALSILSGQREERLTLVRGLAALARGASEGVTFDTIGVTHTGKTWSGLVGGTVTAATAGDAMRGLDQLYQSVQSQPLFASVDLDGVDYASPPKDTSSKRPAASVENGSVLLQFRMSFSLVNPPAPASQAGAVPTGGPR